MKRITLIILFVQSLAAAFPLTSPGRDQGRSAWRWSDGHYGLNLKEPLPPARLGYAILRLRPQSALLPLLPPSTLYAPVPATLDMNLALIPIDRVEELNALAPLAHAEISACGSLEFLPLNYRLVDSIDFASPYFAATASFPELETLLTQVSLERIQQHMNQILTLPTRFHIDTLGSTASSTLVQLWKSQLTQPERWTIEEIVHTNTPQKSVVARLPGRLPERIIIGAHLDSIARAGGKLQAEAPGADDDASGLAILTELLKVIEDQHLSFERTIELHAYAAEEVGLFGSRELAATYRKDGYSVSGMMQIDMSYFSNAADEGTLFLLEDYASRDLRRSAIEWIRRYIGPYYRLGKLPSGSASDHKAWWEQGYSTLFPFENPKAYNPNIHTPDDTSLRFDQGLRTKRIAELGLLFLSYQAGLSQLAPTYEQQQSSLIASNLPRDLYVAIVPATNAEQSYFWVSAPANAVTIEFCPIDAATQTHCGGERLTLESALPQGDRTFFSSLGSFDLLAGQKWRIMAYDATDQAIAWRQIELSE